MVIMRLNDIKGMDTNTLNDKVRELRQEYNREIGLIRSGTSSKSSGKLKEIRRTIARIHTIIRQRGANF